ncbi:MAG: phosphatidylinositol kinase [Chitinophagaceae bacterium]|nr:MAG: phosphatidylinositol kinase [Chitinophagaceae bacterium]
MERAGAVYMEDKKAGRIWQDANGYYFQYVGSYLEIPAAKAVSFTLPISNKIYVSKVLFPFFDGLIPEGWLLDITVKNWKTDPSDRMGLLLSACRDCIGAVSITPENEAS